MSQTIQDLRSVLFDAIAGVRDGSVSLEKAKTISELSQVIVNTAKVEVDFLRASERTESKFLAAETLELDKPAEKRAALPNGIVGIRRHVLKDE